MVDRHPELADQHDLAQTGSGAADSSQPSAHVQPVLLLAVAAGGLVGTSARYLMSKALPTADGAWPTATFLVNLAGAFALGLLLEALSRRGPDTGWRQRARLFGGTGLCGALTTYSTLAVEVDLLARGQHVALAAGYALASVLAGLVATAAGVGLAAVQHVRRERAASEPVAQSRTP